MANKLRIIGVFLFFISFLILPMNTEASVVKNHLNDALKKKPSVDNINFPLLYLDTPPMEGEAVWMVQARMSELGYELNVNGVFDRASCENICLFQTARGMQVDGTVSKEVWQELMFGNLSEMCLSQGANTNRIYIIIDVSAHKLTVYENGKAIKEYPVGVGKFKTPSPLGEWKIISKSVNWGNGFGTRWMGLNVPWGVYGIHGTNKPYSVGGSESHGCIRMLNRNVEELYPIIPWGTTVRIVENGQIFPENFKAVKLQKKSSGQNVVYLQNRLKEEGIVFDNADGRFGSMTELGLKYYQLWNGIEPTGIADEETYRSLGMID